LSITCEMYIIKVFTDLYLQRATKLNGIKAELATE